MCGIAGFAGTGDASTLIRMGKVMAHRGPDQSGVHMDRSRNLRDVGLAHQRLSILDLSECGAQPMSNEEGTIWIAFNGEIYNFKILKESLSGKHQFKSDTDTEVIIHLYEELGEKAFEKLHGMFALALYDKKKDLLFLARDRMGKKPLYWGIIGENAKSFVFASELKSIHEHPLFVKKLSVDALNEYFFSEHVSTPHTIFEGIHKLEPGHYMVWNGTAAQIKPYWHPEFISYEGSYSEAKAELDQRLDTAVSERLIADVPVGVFLSGGIDSSTIAWYAKQKNKHIETFSIGFEDASFDESKYAEVVAKHLGTIHHNEIVSEKELLDIIAKIPDICDEPIADASIVPTTILSEWTRKHVTVALGGDGGDELFYGYDTFAAHKIATMLSWVPKKVVKGIELIMSKLPTSFSNMSLDFKIKTFLKGLEEKDPVYRNEVWMSAFNEKELQQLLKPEYLKDHKATKDFIEETLVKETSYRNDYDKLGRAFERFYMLDHVLVKVDRASMQHALEVRAPFLAAGVVDFAHSLPAHYKLRGFNRKAILKEVMKGRLPDEIINRKKKGFGMPIAAWLNGPLQDLLLKHTDRAYIEQQGIFNYDYVEKLVLEHQSKQKDHRKKLWTLLVFQLWWKRWMKVS